MTKAQRTAPMRRMASGEAGIVIGTHALLEDRVGFADLGLVVVDEQHRFGVEQRAALTDKAGRPPHVLVMTATPIPRTVAMTVFGDLETSTLTELPAGRAPIQTNVVPLAEQPQLDRPGLGAGPRGGRQGPPGLRRLPADHRRRARGGRDRPARPRRGGRPDGRRRHGPAARRRRGRRAERLGRGSARRPAAGRAARPDGRPTTRTARCGPSPRGEIDVLVSTTVIEVGVDVANATAMVLLDADRFGVSQLHQLRGRVGRGGHPGLCLLVTHSPGRHPGPRAARRRRRHHRRLRAEPRSTSSSAGRATCSAGPSRAAAPACRPSGCCATRRRSSRRAAAADRPARRPTPTSLQAPMLAAAVAEWSSHGSLTSWRSHDGHAPHRSDPRRPATADDADHRGHGRRAAASPRRAARTPGPPATGSARRCSRPSSRGAARCTACASSTCTPGPAPSASRRGRAAPAWSRWSSRTAARPR